jgi:hypothetical protein
VTGKEKGEREREEREREEEEDDDEAETQETRFQSGKGGGFRNDKREFACQIVLYLFFFVLLPRFKKMRGIATWLFAAVSALGGAQALYSGGDDVVQLTPANFDTEVTKHDGVVLVEFYGMWRVAGVRAPFGVCIFFFIFFFSS